MTWLTELLNQYRAEIIVAITGLASLSGGVIVYWVRRKIRSMIDAYIAKKNSDTGILLDIKNRVFPEEKLDNLSDMLEALTSFRKQKEAEVDAKLSSLAQIFETAFKDTAISADAKFKIQTLVSTITADDPLKNLENALKDISTKNKEITELSAKVAKLEADSAPVIKTETPVTKSKKVRL